MSSELSHYIARLTLILFAASSVAANAPNVAANLPAVEQLFADFLDAHGALGAIDSGLSAQIGTHDRAYWSRRESLLSKQLSLEFNNIKDKPNGTVRSRALASMRRSFDEMTAAGSDESAPSGTCSDATSTPLADGALRASLYACFDSLGNQIEFEGQRLTRVAALQLLQEIPQSARRKTLFLSMLPLFQAINVDNQASSPYRRLIGTAAAEFAKGRSLIHDAAASLGIDVPEVERWLVRVLESWHAVNGGDNALIEPWDFRFEYALASRSLAAGIPREALLPLQQRFYKDLGADPNALGVIFDIDPRPGKAPLAYSDTIRIGRQIRGHWRPAIALVSANDDRGGLGILNELVHESGHAVHFMAIRARPAFFWPDTTFIEAFADVTSWSVYTPAWQHRYLGAAVTRAQGLREQYAGVMLDVAWSLFELRLLRDSSSDPNALWTDITRRYLGINGHPEMSWWAVRSQLVTDPGYMINYGLGAFMTAEVRARTVAAIGPFDAGNPRWYSWTSKQLLSAGGDPEITTLLRRFLGHAVTPSALIQDIESIDTGKDLP